VCVCVLCVCVCVCSNVKCGEFTDREFDSILNRTF
jgi:hypothetical protein